MKLEDTEADSMEEHTDFGDVGHSLLPGHRGQMDPLLPGQRGQIDPLLPGKNRVVYGFIIIILHAVHHPENVAVASFDEVVFDGSCTCDTVPSATAMFSTTSASAVGDAAEPACKARGRFLFNHSIRFGS